jgi:ATP-binding protein involved in chromosome partitioning
MKERTYVMDKTTKDIGMENACPPRKLPGKDEVEELKEKLMLDQNICGIRHKIMVMSGKGGVGKSSLAANIAVSLSLKGKQVGLMDIDIHGPSIPRIVGLEGTPLRQSAEGLMPVEYSDNLKVMSIGFLMKDQRDAVIWRAPIKHSLIRQFLTDVRWGDLDYLIVDCPPGTGDELISIAQLLEDADGALIVTTPQDVALNDVRKSITFCRHVQLPVLGVIENMSGFVCPHCGNKIDIFKTGGGERMASEMGVPFLGRIPIDPRIVEQSDSGEPFLQYCPRTETAAAFESVITPLLNVCAGKKRG